MARTQSTSSWCRPGYAATQSGDAAEANTAAHHSAGGGAAGRHCERPRTGVGVPGAPQAGDGYDVLPQAGVGGRDRAPAGVADYEALAIVVDYEAPARIAE